MKIGIVGLGSIGSRHFANAASLGHDVRGYDPQTPSSFRFEREVYDWADAVVIATPSIHHEAGLRACVERGKHVLIEKPISTSLGQLELLLAHAQANNLVVMMGNNLRFHSSVKRAKQWLDGGLIGNTNWAQFTCATKSEKSVYHSDGIILNTGAHEIDLAMHLIGAGEINYASAAVAADGRSDMMVDFTMIHGFGPRSSFHLDFETPVYTRTFTVGGTQGVLHCDLEDRILMLRPIDPKQTLVEYGSGSWDSDYLDEMKAFIARIDGEETFGATGQDGLSALYRLLDVRKKAGL